MSDVEYQVRAHFEWNLHHPDLANDRNEGKHFSVAQRMLERGGRQDIFLGTRDCQGYVMPCEFGSEIGSYDTIERVDYGLTFHGFAYPDETGEAILRARFWRPVMEHGVIHFPRPEQCDILKEVRPMVAKQFGQSCVLSVDLEASDLGA
ncbi:CRISPR-associated protein [Vitreoscilla filiformis]|uniref:CRISPR-associated protein n=1 Tax=Vitreoscilla filiformis TaxID=63 RepID=A0A221KH78_VITFI|nr:CRISPR-associated protein [Vitreoscilla filiformis]